LLQVYQNANPNDSIFHVRGNGDLYTKGKITARLDSTATATGGIVYRDAVTGNLKLTAASTLGTNISNASLSANGSYTQDWNQQQLKVDSISFLHLTGTDVVSSRRQNLEIRQQANTFALPFQAQATVKSVDGVTDSLVNRFRIFGHLTELGAASSINDGAATVNTTTNGEGSLPQVALSASDGTFPTFRSSSVSASPTRLRLLGNDSITIKGVEAAASADSILGVRRTTNNEFKVIRIPYVAGSSDGNGIYTGSGSLSTPTTVTLGSNDLTFNATSTGVLKFNLGSDATGDSYYRDASGIFTRLPAGSEGDLLTIISGVPGWATPTANPTLYTSSGSLSGNTTITGGTNTLTLTGTHAASSAMSIQNTGAGNALSLTATGSGPTALISNTSTGIGLQITSADGNALNVTSDNNTAATFSINPATTNTTERAINIIRRTTGTAAANIGVSAAFQLEDDAGNSYAAAQFKAVATNSTAASKTTSFLISTVLNAVSNDRFSILGTGQVRQYAYGVNAFSVTPATTPVISSNGTIGERIAPKIYTALLTQSGTGAPTATVLGTNEIGAIVWTRNSAGNYTGTLTGAFTADKTWLVVQKGDGSGSFVNSILSRASANALTLDVRDNTNTVTDNFTNMSIRIEVYP
jgi:hypothetical protein